MIPLYSTNQIREADQFAINQLGIPGIVLMENASREIFSSIVERINLKENIVGIVCGKGNNGGDGFAVARHFINNNFKVNVLHLGNEELSPDAKINFNILGQISRINKNLKLKKYSSKKDINFIKNSSLIIDALLGSGAQGDLREPYKEIVDSLNSIKAFKIAIDIPTGLNADKGFASSVFKADLTVTLGELKKGLFYGDGSLNAGEIVKGDIGIGFSFFDRFETGDYLIEPEDAFYSLPSKSAGLHKYSAGKVLTIAGSGELPGAAVMTSKAVLKAGAGASILCFPKSVRKLVHKNLTEVIVKIYDDNNSEIFSEKNIKEIDEKLSWADVLAIGPGLGRNQETLSGIIRVLKERKTKRIVIDADAIYALKDNHYKKMNLKDFVLTPHHGEFSALIGISAEDLKKDILKFGKEFTKETKSYLVLKGAPTIIFNPAGEAFINTSGNPGMAKFGTGDVLTGILAGFLAQQNDIEKAIISGVYLHSLSADLLLKDKTEFGFTAEDIMNKFPDAIKFLRKSLV